MICVEETQGNTAEHRRSLLASPGVAKSSVC